MSVRSQRYTQLLDEVMQSMQPYVRAYTHKDQLLLDVAPLLLEIIIPNLRPVGIYVMLYFHSYRNNKLWFTSYEENVLVCVKKKSIPT